MDKTAVILGYLCSLLSMEQQEELKQLVGENSPDIVGDALSGRNGLAMDRLPPRLHRAAVARHRPDASKNSKGFAERFPGATRIGHGGSY